MQQVVPERPQDLQRRRPQQELADCTRVLLACRGEDGLAGRLLPTPLEPAGDVILVSWLLIGDVDGYAGSKNVAVSVPARVGEHTGKCCVLEYIDLDMGLAAGREYWSYPKKGGDFVWEQDGPRLRLDCRRHGDLLFRSTVTLGDEAADGWPDEVGYPPIGPSSLQVRHYAPTPFGVPDHADVLRIDYPNSVQYESTRATATLEVTSGPRDDLDVLGGLDVLAARVDRHAFDFPLGEVVDSRAI
ncbi:hypothetical protein amrb99_11770 [Actinomadura sp. RB99]|uniref:acetoacetate decarboxylase family protein n=1 Tax=Actinomadura sp. RB99 TaxID=2691577 RepID=UPI00168272FB|nr:hypothetical protein [Actinomadura sp. RB99]